MKDFYIEKETGAAKEHGVSFFIQRINEAGNITYLHLHPAVEILYMTKGVFEVYADGQKVSAQPGDLIVFRANTVHYIRLTEGRNGEYCVLKVSPTALLQFFYGSLQLKYSMPFLIKSHNGTFHYPAASLPDEIPRIFNSLTAEFSAPDDLLYVSQRIYASSLLLLLMRSMPDFNSNDSSEGINRHTLDMIYEVLSYVNENFRSNITAQFCAQYIHVSYSYFARLFRIVTGKTFKEYLGSVRLAKAQDMLGESDMPITDIALSCGYNSLSYFIAEYKKAFGITPNRARTAK